METKPEADKEETTINDREIIVNRIRGSEWDKLVDALFLVASVCEKMRGAYHASSLSIRVSVPTGEEKPVSSIEVCHGVERATLGRFTLEALAEKLLKDSVAEKIREFKRDEFARD